MSDTFDASDFIDYTDIIEGRDMKKTKKKKVLGYKKYKVKEAPMLSIFREHYTGDPIKPNKMVIVLGFKNKMITGTVSLEDFSKALTGLSVPMPLSMTVRGKK